MAPAPPVPVPVPLSVPGCAVRSPVPPGTVRVALLGASNAVGSGVADHEVFEAVVEERLAAAPGPVPVEILNFSVPGYGPIAKLDQLERKALAFSPRLVVFVSSRRDPEFVVHQAGLHLAERWPPDHPILAEAARRAGIGAGTDRAVIERRVQPLVDELILSTYRRTVRLCARAGAVPIWMHLPPTHGIGDPGPRLEALARRAGFRIWDLAGVYDGRDPVTLRIGPWDGHPNALGHRLIAARVERHLRRELAALAAPGGAPPEPAAGEGR